MRACWPTNTPPETQTQDVICILLAAHSGELLTNALCTGCLSFPTSLLCPPPGLLVVTSQINYLPSPLYLRFTGWEGSRRRQGTGCWAGMTDPYTNREGEHSLFAEPGTPPACCDGPSSAPSGLKSNKPMHSTVLSQLSCKPSQEHRETPSAQVRASRSRVSTACCLRTSEGAPCRFPDPLALRFLTGWLWDRMWTSTIIQHFPGKTL